MQDTDEACIYRNDRVTPDNIENTKVEVKIMPIHDHFKGKISHTRSWSAFHYLWAGLIAGELNRVLPEGFIVWEGIKNRCVFVRSSGPFFGPLFD